MTTNHKTETNGLAALVTGGGSGIGRALALQLADQGHTVLVCGRNSARLSETVQSGGGRIAAVGCDITTEAGRARVVKAVRELNRPLDLLVNNAGVQYEMDFRRHAGAAVDTTRVEAEIAINLTAPIRLTGDLLPLLRQPGAIVVNVTSLLGRHPKASAPVYCAAKAGLRAFTRALRHQLAADGIAVVEAVPPLVDTAMTAGRDKRKISPEQAARELLAGLRRATPEVGIGVGRLMLKLDRIAPTLVARLMIGG